MSSLIGVEMFVGGGGGARVVMGVSHRERKAKEMEGWRWVYYII
jgi:hypothetical protein